MASDFGRHHADDNAIDRARIQYLAGEPSSVDPTSADLPGTDTDSAPVQLGDADRAELDELRALLADPNLWSEPPAELENSVVALIAAEATSGAPSDAEVEQFPFVRSMAEPGPDRPAAPGPDRPAAPIDLGAARRGQPGRTGPPGGHPPAR